MRDFPEHVDIADVRMERGEFGLESVEHRGIVEIKSGPDGEMQVRGEPVPDLRVVGILPEPTQNGCEPPMRPPGRVFFLDKAHAAHDRDRESSTDREPERETAGFVQGIKGFPEFFFPADPAAAFIRQDRLDVDFDWRKVLFQKRAGIDEERGLSVLCFVRLSRVVRFIARSVRLSHRRVNDALKFIIRQWWLASFRIGLPQRGENRLGAQALRFQTASGLKQGVIAVPAVMRGGTENPAPLGSDAGSGGRNSINSDR